MYIYLYICIIHLFFKTYGARQRRIVNMMASCLLFSETKGTTPFLQYSEKSIFILSKKSKQYSCNKKHQGQQKMQAMTTRLISEKNHFVLKKFLRKQAGGRGCIQINRTEKKCCCCGLFTHKKFNKQQHCETKHYYYAFSQIFQSKVTQSIFITNKSYTIICLGWHVHRKGCFFYQKKCRYNIYIKILLLKRLFLFFVIII